MLFLICSRDLFKVFKGTYITFLCYDFSFWCTIFQAHQFVTHRKDNQQEKWSLVEKLMGLFSCLATMQSQIVRFLSKTESRAPIYYAGNSLDF